MLPVFFFLFFLNLFSLFVFAYYYFSKTDKQLAVDKLFSVKLEHLMNFLSSHEVQRPYKQQLRPQSQSHRRGHHLATWQHQTV